MAFRPLEKHEIEEFTKENKAIAEEFAESMAHGHCDLCPYADILHAWEWCYDEIVTDIIPVAGSEECGCRYNHVTYLIKTKHGDSYCSFMNRSGYMNNVDYAAMRIGQTLNEIERKKRRDRENEEMRKRLDRLNKQMEKHIKERS